MMANLVKKESNIQKVIAGRAESAPPPDRNRTKTFPVVKNLMDMEFIISKLDFNVSMNKNELFGVCVNFCSIF